LYFFKANTPFKVKEREKKGMEKHYSQSERKEGDGETL
jgi:hypothetical protein